MRSERERKEPSILLPASPSRSPLSVPSERRGLRRLGFWPGGQGSPRRPPHRRRPLRLSPARWRCLRDHAVTPSLPPSLPGRPTPTRSHSGPRWPGGTRHWNPSRMSTLSTANRVTQSHPASQSTRNSLPVSEAPGPAGFGFKRAGKRPGPAEPLASRGGRPMRPNCGRWRSEAPRRGAVTRRRDEPHLGPAGGRRGRRLDVEGGRRGS